MQTLRSDVTHFIKATRRRPGIALTCVMTLALGVGASTAMFSVVESVLLRPLPYPEPNRLVSVYPTWPTIGQDRATWSWPEYFGVEERQAVFSDMAAYEPFLFMTLAGDGPPEQLQVPRTTWNLFPLLGATPVVGRLFDAGDTRDSRVVVLSHGAWERRFGSDPGVVGRAITLDENPWVVLGVLPEGFEIEGASPPIWRIWTGSADEGDIGAHMSTRSIARLADGVDVERADEEITRLIRADPNHGESHEASVFPRQEDETRQERPIILMMLAASLLLLVVACGNTAALLLGAGIDRERELAIRAAVGASRRRLIGQLVTESVVLGLVAAAGGIIAAMALTRLLLLVAPGGIPGLAEASLNPTVLAFVVSMAIACGAAAGLVPGLTLSSAHLAGAMGSPRTTVRSRERLQSAVVVGELMLATVLVISAMLLTRTVGALDRVDPGIEVERLAVVQVGASSRSALGALDGPREDAPAAEQSSLREEIAALPGVESVAVTSRVLLTDDSENNPVVPDGWDQSRTAPLAERRLVSPDFFETTGIRILEGRALESQDWADGAMPAVVISEALARLGWPDRSPIGNRILYYRDDEPGIVVGVATNVHDEELRNPAALALYAPGGDIGWMLIRTAGDPAELLPSIRDRIEAVDPTVPIIRSTTLADLVDQNIADERYRARLMAIFAAFAAALALMGVYGVTSRSVARRARELGVRLALGAKTVTVHRMVTIQALRLAMFGVLAGLALSLAGWQVLERFIWGVSVADPLTLTAAILVFPACAALAALGPARRATRVDPLQVLKGE
jgi:putative ABC transport system permease protein